MASNLLERGHAICSRFLAWLEAARQERSFEGPKRQKNLEFLHEFLTHVYAAHCELEAATLIPTLERLGMPSGYGPLASLRSDHEEALSLGCEIEAHLDEEPVSSSLEDCLTTLATALKRAEAKAEVLRHWMGRARTPNVRSLVRNLRAFEDSLRERERVTA